MTDAAHDPSTPSLAHEQLAPLWAMIRAILSGAKAVKAAGTKYLPQYPAESDPEYRRRLDSTPWRPEFEDCLRAISSKPFAKEVTLAGEPSEDMKIVAEDVDGRGNNLHTFARDLFEWGVSQGAAGILVDFPTMNPNATRAEEKAAGARPYWVSIAADEIIALRTERRGAREVVTHLRLRETATVVNGFEEAIEEKIRVIEPGFWQLWHEVKDTAGNKTWEVEAEGVLTLDEVPFVFYATAERKGPQYVRPPLLDLAEMQLELYRSLSRLDEVLTYAGSPMLSAEGIGAPSDGSSHQVGPKVVLYTGESSGSEGARPRWTYVQPDASNIKELREQVGSVAEDMRRLGMQPMLPKTGTITATASGIDASKAHSAVQAWALELKDCLEQAFVFTAMWLGTAEEVEVSIHTDFAVGIYGAEEVKALIDARKERMISERTLWGELTRRGVLGPQFDPDDEEEALIKEMPGDDDIDTALPGDDPPEVDA